MLTKWERCYLTAFDANFYVLAGRISKARSHKVCHHKLDNPEFVLLIDELYDLA
jgi:hypothetical protein